MFWVAIDMQSGPITGKCSCGTLTWAIGVGLIWTLPAERKRRLRFSNVATSWYGVSSDNSVLGQSPLLCCLVPCELLDLIKSCGCAKDKELARAHTYNVLVCFRVLIGISDTCQCIVDVELMSACMYSYSCAFCVLHVLHRFTLCSFWFPNAN